jgi:hypothetical protein
MDINLLAAAWRAVMERGQVDGGDMLVDGDRVFRGMHGTNSGKLGEDAIMADPGGAARRL